jgi:hypothetical protein
VSVPHVGVPDGTVGIDADVVGWSRPRLPTPSGRLS